MANIDRLKTLTYETTGRIARITLNRPERGNGITLDMPAEIAAFHPNPRRRYTKT